MSDSTLAAQLAHVKFIGLQALTTNVSAYTADYLTKHVMVWAQHVELAWATLGATEQEHALLYANHLLATTRESKRLLTSAYMKKRLEALHPSTCRRTILEYIICNQDTPASVRIAAIHQYKEAAPSCTLGELVDQQLVATRRCWALARLATTFSDELRKADTNKSQKDMEKLRSEIQMLNTIHPTAFPILEAAAQYAASDIQAFVSQIFSSGSTDLLNGVLTATLLSYDPSAAPQEARDALCNCVELEFSHLLAATSEAALKLDARVIAGLSARNSTIACKYVRQLVQLNSRCQLTMLGDDVENAEADLVGPLVVHWEMLYLECTLLVQSSLRKDSQRFSALIAGRQPKPLEVVVEFWTTFYGQLLQ